MSDAITAARRIFYEHDGPWLRCRAAERLGWNRYSHPALFDMDLRLAELMPWRGGTFVEAGAHDGFTQSNTYYLERRCGWSGVLVEPLPELREKCARRRPRSRVFGCALVGEDRDSAEVDIHFGDLMSSVVDRAHAAGGLALRRRQTYTVSVPARTLSSVLDEAGVGSIDLLVLDVEGNELEALRGLDLERHTPRYMLIEALELEAMRPVFVDALAPRYVLAEEPSPYDLLFRRSEPVTLVPRVLLVNPNCEDYLCDAVLHGLRTLLGADAVDFPKAEYMYEGAPAETMERVRGGFTLYQLLPELPILRDHMLARALGGEFDLVIFGDIWRTFGIWTEWAPQLRRARIPMAVLDGSDRVEPYPYAGQWWRVRAWWFLPRAHNRAPYFKREITPWSRWFASYLMLPPRFGRTLSLLQISFAIPEEKILAEVPEKRKDFPRHIVDAEVAARVGAQTGYAFADEGDYYADLRASRYGVTTKRQGWDALRHYEIAASAAVPCFRDLDRKPATCAPHGLDESNSISYRDADDLQRRIERVTPEAYSRLQAGALAWARGNTTVVRARELLAACGLEVVFERPAAAHE